MPHNPQQPPAPEQGITPESLVYLHAQELWKAYGCPAQGPALDHWFDAVRAITSTTRRRTITEKDNPNKDANTHINRRITTVHNPQLISSGLGAATHPFPHPIFPGTQARNSKGSDTKTMLVASSQCNSQDCPGKKARDEMPRVRNGHDARSERQIRL